MGARNPGCMRGTHVHQIEYLVVAMEATERKVKLSLRQAEILEALAKDEELCKQGGCVPNQQAVQR